MIYLGYAVWFLQNVTKVHKTFCVIVFHGELRSICISIFIINLPTPPSITQQCPPNEQCPNNRAHWGPQNHVPITQPPVFFGKGAFLLTYEQNVDWPNKRGGVLHMRFIQIENINLHVCVWYIHAQFSHAKDRDCPRVIFLDPFPILPLIGFYLCVHVYVCGDRPKEWIKERRKEWIILKKHKK